MTCRAYKKHLLNSVVCSIVLAAPATAFAQSEQNATTVDDIVVTATRQSTSINRTPLSIAAMTQESLDRQGVTDVADLARAIHHWGCSGHGGEPGLKLTREADTLVEVLAIMDFV
jgi:outer membrane cobalamin receptor